MSAQVTYVRNAHTSAWIRTVTPTNIGCAVYSPARRAIVYITGDGTTAPDLIKNDADTDLSHASAMKLTTYPIIPDGDPVRIKTFHDATLLVSDAVNPPTVSFDMTVSGERLRVAAQLVDPDTQRCEAQREIGRNGGVESMLTLTVEPSENSQQAWRINALAVHWSPLGTESRKFR